MNNPFDYIPSQSMLVAQQSLIAHIETLRVAHTEFRDEVDKGKMFGILITPTSTCYAFSGQIADRYDWEGFVPPVFDYLDEQGYFKVHEREITQLNNKVHAMECSNELQELRVAFRNLSSDAEADIEEFRKRMNAAKAERDQLRRSGYADDTVLIRESQYMKAELHRRKLYWRERLQSIESRLQSMESDIRMLKLQRQHRSDALQRWLFQQFVFTDYKGDSRSLLDLAYPMTLPPSGAGECCEPKLLNYAYTNHIEPIEMGMFWWGESPRQEIRHHLQFYPACNGKCKPILQFMLPPDALISVDDNYAACADGKFLKTLYEDDALIVVDKPAGMLSVPGKNGSPSVYSLLKASHPDCDGLQMVHRLDMDTSGLLVVAKNKVAHECLQRQFAEHSVYKEYVALLEHRECSNVESGEISLKLRPDYNDRPRQLVDDNCGKTAVTRYSFASQDGENPRVRLIPLTGRTHQLRVHCAHNAGLSNPIKGDRLYGNPGARLCLHAAILVFTHPVTGERLTFSSQDPF